MTGIYSFIIDWSDFAQPTITVSEAHKEDSENPDDFVNMFLYLGDGVYKRFYTKTTNMFRLSAKVDLTLGVLISTNKNSQSEETVYGAESENHCLQLGVPFPLTNKSAHRVVLASPVSEAPVEYKKSADAIVLDLETEMNSLLEKSVFVGNPQEIMSMDVAKVREEVRKLMNPDRGTILANKKREIKKQMEGCRDELGDVLEEKKDEYEKYRSQLIKLRKEEKELGDGRKAKVSICENVREECLNDKNLLDTLPDRLVKLQKEMNDLRENALAELRRREEEEESRQETSKKERLSLEADLAETEKSITVIKSSQDVKRLRNEEREMNQKILKFYEDFGVNRDFENDYGKALRIMEEEWRVRCEEFERDRSAFERRRDILKDISNYIKGGAIERDSEELNAKLLKKINVFGVTSTADNKFNDIDLNKQNIDVVIIDEVSKSSFLDLLRPALYGKTVVLVGDHLQLPPMYDLKHMRSEDFEGLDEEIINENRNEHYRELVETCFFKELFEKVPDTYKVMLDCQYRFHSHIMRINPFYGGRLKLGRKDLDASKEHGLEIVINGHRIITPEKHVCFVDTSDSYESGSENSTSLWNKGERDCVCELLSQINLHTSSNNPLSVGVICMYGLQAGEINKYIRKNKKRFNQLLNNKKERFIVSTVDDFQGDERDVIILSMVRNKSTKSKLDFVKQFQRINVAITRPRKLLIIVGAANFLKKNVKVDVPGQGDVRIFDKILQEAHNQNGYVGMSSILPE